MKISRVPPGVPLFFFSSCDDVKTKPRKGLVEQETNLQAMPPPSPRAWRGGTPPEGNQLLGAPAPISIFFSHYEHANQAEDLSLAC